jgi:hypothetical protein
MQRLLPLPITGQLPDDQDAYGRVYATVEAIGQQFDNLREELQFDGVLTDVTGRVHLTYRGRPVAEACMSSRHAEARLVVK